MQPGTLGALNSRLGTCYSGVTGVGNITYDASPDMTSKELSIVGALYEVGWYSRLAQTMMGLTPDGIPFTHIREGDESYQRANPVNIGKEYREMAKDARARADYLISAYNQGESNPNSVSYLNPPSHTYNPYGRIGGVWGYGDGQG